jgi:hypothetical protein
MNSTNGTDPSQGQDADGGGGGGLALDCPDYSIEAEETLAIFSYWDGTHQMNYYTNYSLNLTRR